MRRPIVVQQSFPEPRSTTNPYIVMLRESLAATPGLHVRTFSWWAALVGRYDVFHVHWPEILVSGASPLKTLGRQVLTVALLLRLRLTRTPLVHTLHNPGPPRGGSRRSNAILAALGRQTSLVILLNSTTSPPPGLPSETIVHGDYRQWFARYDKPTARPGQFGYFGLIRPYKGVDQLVRVFGELPGSYALRIAGQPTPELAARLTALAAQDTRVDLTLAYVSDEELVRLACESELVVLPYAEMHNSGGALTGLSLDRPILVPANEVNHQLQHEVGPGWVHTYGGRLTAARLLQALTDTRLRPPTARPRLDTRDWDQAGRLHLAAYSRALRTVDRPTQDPG